MTDRRACGCNDFSRTELARRAVAEAGRGLPPIEPGMPLPAGTGLNRRTFLSRAAGLALAVYGGTKLASQAYDDGIARAAAAPSDAVLISIFLDGGAVDPLPGRRSEVPGSAPEAGAPGVVRDRLQRGRAPALAPVPRLAGDAPRRGEGHGHARYRLYEP